MRLVNFLIEVGAIFSLLLFFLLSLYFTYSFFKRIISFHPIVVYIITTFYMMFIPYIYFIFVFIGSSLYIEFPMQMVMIYIGSIIMILTIITVIVIEGNDYYIYYLLANNILLLIGGILLLVYPVSWLQVPNLLSNQPGLSYGLFLTVASSFVLAVTFILILLVLFSQKIDSLDEKIDKLSTRIDTWFEKLQEVEEDNRA